MCKSRRELSNAYLLAKFGFDTAENGPCKICTIKRCNPLSLPPPGNLQRRRDRVQDRPRSRRVGPGRHRPEVLERLGDEKVVFLLSGYSTWGTPTDVSVTVFTLFPFPRSGLPIGRKSSSFREAVLVRETEGAR